LNLARLWCQAKVIIDDQLELLKQEFMKLFEYVPKTDEMLRNAQILQVSPD